VNIARKVELYNQASHLARAHLSQRGELDESASVTARLHESIRRQITLGADDPVVIAAAVIRELHERP